MQIKMHTSRTAAAVLCALAATLGASAAQAQSRVSVGVTQTISSHNPYGDSHAMGYAVACQTYGCLGLYDYKKGEYVGMLAERWETPDENTWIFHLRKDARWHNGEPVTAEDVVHSHTRVMTDPQSKQKANASKVAKAEALDKHTVKFTTAEPTAPLLEFVFGRLIITNKAIYDKYGAKVADREHPIGFGPYKIKDISVGQHIVLEKVKGHPGATSDNPDELIFRVMREPEQRVTALLNGEIQIAQYVPPHLVERVKESPNARLAVGNSTEVNFLAMNPNFKPWGNKLLRQAVAYAIDRDAIIKSLLHGYADKLDGPIGPGQYGYDPDVQPKYTYDPAKARELLKKAGFPNGVTVDFYTPVGRYMGDKQTSEAIVGMLRAVGINAQLKTPEWPTLWSDIQRGKAPFYYMGRGQVTDPTVMMSQYLETGVSPRVGYSNPRLDELLRKERSTFDPNERKKVLVQVFSLILEEVPMHFLWRMKLLDGIANNIEYTPEPGGGIFGVDIKVTRN